MLLYPRSFSGIGLLFTCAGSALPRAMVPAIFSTVWCIILEVIIIDSESRGAGEDNTAVFDNPFPYQVFASMVGFALVFRTNVAYNRYWEGLTNFRTLSVKWGDCATMILGFDAHTKTDETKATREQFAAYLVHRISLLHALACAHLRREVDLRLSSEPAPPTPIDVGIFNYDDGLLRRESIEGRCYNGFGFVIKLLCSFSNFWRACRHSTSRDDDHLTRTPLKILGGISQDERFQLEHLDSEARVNAIFAQVLAMCNRRRAAGGVQVDPPVLARFHHEMCNGMAGFQQACKLEDTPFPFPYAQVVSYVLSVFAITYPMVAISQIDGILGTRAYWLPPCLSFISVLTYFGFHEVARELEDPFLHPPNELPMISIHETFNTRLTATWEAIDDVENEAVARGPTDRMVVAGLCGIHGTPAEQLLEAWKKRNQQLVPASAQQGNATGSTSGPPSALPSVHESDDLGHIQLISPGDVRVPVPRDGSVTSSVNSVSRGRRGSTAGRRKAPKSGSHVRNALHAQRLSFQLVSVP